jgi:hypothetical protein
MNALLLATWLSLPLAPLNPVKEDTLSAMSLHLTAGLACPNGIVSAGPILSANYEMLVIHPFMVRGTVDFKYGRVRSILFPQGHLWSMMLGSDAIYYRGTDYLTGYIGFGFVYSLHNFVPFEATSDSLYLNEGLTDVDVQQKWGYRLVLGLRYHKSYSLEVGVVELQPDFKKSGRDSNGVESRSYQTTRTGSFRITVGYLFDI